MAKSWLPAKQIVAQAVAERLTVDPSGQIIKLEGAGAPWKVCAALFVHGRPWEGMGGRGRACDGRHRWTQQGSWCVFGGGWGLRINPLGYSLLEVCAMGGAHGISGVV